MWMDKPACSVCLQTVKDFLWKPSYNRKQRLKSNPIDQCVCACVTVTTLENRESDQWCTIQLLPKSIAIVMFRVPVGVLIGDNCSSETINKAS